MPTKTTNRVPKLRLHKATGQAVVTLDGKDHYLGQHSSPKSRERYDRLITKWLANGRRLLTTTLSDLTVTELISAYWRDASTNYQSNHLHKIKVGLRPLKRLYGSTKANEFGPLALQLVRQSMIDAGLARTTINATIILIRGVFKWGVAHQLVEPGVLQGLQAVNGLRRGRTDAREPEPVKPVPQAYIDAIQPYVSRQVWALVQLQLLTGARAGELVGIRPVDLNTQGNVWVYTPPTHKNAHHGHERTIYIGPRGQEVIRPFLLRPVDAYLFSPREAIADRAAKAQAHRRPDQMPSPRKTNRVVRDHYDVNSYRKAIQRGCDRAFPPPDSLDGDSFKKWQKEHRWHPHQLRHNAATFIRREEGIEVARIILGHRSAGVTEIYAEQDREKAIEAIQRLG